jgi:glycosyltransferase involved in cell wall biosynthesis
VDAPSYGALAAGRGTHHIYSRDRKNGATAPQQSQVTLLPDFPEAQKPALLAATDIFVLPSAEESFGIALVEAWAAGLPVIGADRGAIASVIAEGQDGLLFDYPQAASLAQAIITLLDNPAQRVLLGQNGLQKVRSRYTWQAVAGQVRAVYERLVERSA